MSENTKSRITIGENNDFHTYPDSNGTWPYDYYATISWAAVTSADYCLMAWSFDKVNNKVTTFVRTNTGYTFTNTVGSSTYSNSVTSNSGANYFGLVTDSGNVPVYLYDMVIFDEYMVDDRAAFSSFGVLEDYVKEAFGM
eukprot:3689258-Pyramimonas_sp.AAC.1